MSTSPDKLRILVLTADPKDQPQPALNAEVELLREELESRHPDRVRIDEAQSVTPEIFADFIARYKPHVLHFAGHGNTRGEPYLLDTDDAGRPASVRVLRDMLAKASELRCVVLNACNSARAAQELALHLPVPVIGHASEIEDTCLRKFAQRLYHGIADGSSIARAVKDARTVLAPTCESLENVGKIKAGPEVEADTVVLLPPRMHAEARPLLASKPSSAEDLDALAQLLRSLFQSDEFCRFLGRNSDTAPLRDELPTGIPATELFDRAVLLLEKRGLLASPFFKRLQGERPHRGDILPMRQRFVR